MNAKIHIVYTQKSRTSEAIESSVEQQHCTIAKSPQALFEEASAYISLFHQEQAPLSNSLERLRQISREIETTGTYRQTYNEVAYGAQVAWRNSSRCIGRLHWSLLHIRDMRSLSKAEDIFAALVEHIRFATNRGKILPMLTVFAPQTPGQPGIRIWNPQLIRYAGYVQTNGSVIGDAAHAELTEVLLQAGWKGGKRTPFDILPVVIQMPYMQPQMFELPPDLIMEVPIAHPDYAWFAELGLKWYALPVISNMCLEIGGISYTAAPFNGWYMGTEIGARNFGDQNRYNLLPVVAEKLGLSMHSERTLWKDRAMVELNVAVLDSFTRHKVSIVDHHTASRQFILHEEHERKFGRSVNADWGWIVPPLSASATPVFHKYYVNSTITPNFFYQHNPW